MTFERQIFTYKSYFLDFYEGLEDNVQRKIEWTLNLIRLTKQVPEKYFKHLEELILGLTYIKKIHPNLYKLKKLKKLDLAGNFFNEIPKGISALKNLEELNLNLYFGNLPNDIVKLKKLNSMKLGFNS